MIYFTLKELTRSSYAIRHKITNQPSAEIISSLNSLCSSILDILRKAYGKPITVNSGYRSPKVNKAVGGASTSQHTKGEAADITAGSKEENKKLFELIQTLNLPFDQLINEKNYSWIHVSHKANGKNRGQILNA